MWIEAKVPYAYRETLADAYNRAMKTSKANWVLLLDHDIFLASNIHWYKILLKGIKQVDVNKTGLITCVTSGRGSLPQGSNVTEEKVRHPDIRIHLQEADRLYKKYGTEVKEINSYHIAGFFMLINKSVWEKIKFSSEASNNGIDKIDHDYCRKLLNNEYKIYVMPGLYVYHMRYRWTTKRGTNHGKTGKSN